jgi:ribosome maturation factor RimP
VGRRAHFFFVSAENMNESVRARVWQIAEPLAASEGMEIVDIEFRRESHGMILRVFADRAGGGGVSLDDLAKISRQLGDLLDVHDVVPGAYTLELSSPGIDRRLRLPDHFRRYLGKRVRVRSTVPISGRRVFNGVLEAVDGEGVRVGIDGASHFIPFIEIAQANYEADQ